MKATLSLLLASSLLLGGCKAKEMFDDAKIAADLQNKGTFQLLKETADDSYDPPSDGKLTDAQIQMYLKVREHEKKIVQVARENLKAESEKADKNDKSLRGLAAGFKALGSVADVFTADIRAAKELGINTAEYLWVKGQVIEAGTAAMAEEMHRAAAAMFDSTYTQLKEQHEQATDEASKSMMAEMLRNYNESRKQMDADREVVSPAVAHNRTLLAKYDGALNALAHEMSKWETNPGDAQRSMDEFSRQMSEAVADAQNQ
jgi:chromosome segregation ATPase